MNAIESDTEALWNAIAIDHTNWQLWRCLADEMEANGDSIGAEFCLWIVGKKRATVYSDGNYTWGYWKSFDNSKVFCDACIPNWLGEILFEYKRQEWLEGSGTKRRSYEFLLEGWRLLTDEQRTECKE